MKNSLFLFCSFLLFAQNLLAGDPLRDGGHKFAPIDVCYHWLEPHQLQPKINAGQKDGSLFFYGSAPIYCWRTPLGAYTDWEQHGDELIRIKFKPDVKIVNISRIENVQRMRDQGREVVYSNDTSWHEYTIAPEAVESWSVDQPETLAEMKSEVLYHQKDLATSDDVFFPASVYRKEIYSRLARLIEKKESEIASGFRTPRLYGKNLDQHFESKYSFAWQQFIDKSTWRNAGAAVIDSNPGPALNPPLMAVQPAPAPAPMVVPPPAPNPAPQVADRRIRIIDASYGRNISGSNRGNATNAAGRFCNGKKVCHYKVSPKFLGDPVPNAAKDFEVEWNCGQIGEASITRSIPAPADDKVFDISCN